MDNDIRPANGWLWLTVPIALLLAIASGGGLFVKGLYRDVPFFATQAIGQDLISIIIVLPTLIISAFLAFRGSLRSRLVWLGVMVYLVYTYVMGAFVVKFNPLFLVYVALLGCSLYGLIGGLVTINMDGIKASFTERAPVKVVSIYLAVLAVLFTFIWLSETVPALLGGRIPQSVQDSGTPTNAVHVLDLAWILPALGITAVSLWRERALGYTLAGALLSYGVLLITAILSMVVFMIRNGHPLAVPQIVIFAIVWTVSLAMLIWFLKGLKSKPTQS
jgi:hypothetical protein